MSAPDAGPGLCAACASGRRVESVRGSVFWRCERSAADPAFPKYPRLPVLRCAGYRRGVPRGATKGGSR